MRGWRDGGAVWGEERERWGCVRGRRGGGGGCVRGGGVEVGAVRVGLVWAIRWVGEGGDTCIERLLFVMGYGWPYVCG